MNRDFRKYLGYAAGEILLVIAGIIIALQIDTWWENKRAQERLDDYLANIERDIDDDLRRLTELKRDRATAIFESYATIAATSDPDGDDPEWYDEALTASASAALEKAQKKLNFIANAGGYRALSASGLTSEIADAELESMLYDYYRTVERITDIEQDMNSVVRELSLRFQTEVGQGLDPFVRREPLFMWQGEYPEDVRETARQQYWGLLVDSITHSLLRNQLNQGLLQEYEHLLTLGRHLLARIGGADVERAGAVYSAAAAAGHPVVLERGRPGYHSYGLFEAPAAPDNFHIAHRYVQVQEDALDVTYPGGDPWAYLFLLQGPISPVVERFARDFSMYDRIRVELKRDPATACADLYLEIKDIEDAEKGGLQSIPLVLTPEWQTYTYDLSEFAEADLTRLNVVAGFLFGSDEPCSISIRNVQYTEPA